MVANNVEDNFIIEDPLRKKKNGPNGFIKFRSEYWRTYKLKFPSVTTQQFSSIAADLWKELPNTKRNYYIKLSEKEKEKNKNMKKIKRTKRPYKKKTKKMDVIDEQQPTINQFGIQPNGFIPSSPSSSSEDYAFSNNLYSNVFNSNDLIDYFYQDYFTFLYNNYPYIQYHSPPPLPPSPTPSPISPFCLPDEFINMCIRE